MPYIVQGNRAALDPAIKALAEEIKALGDECLAGNLNYAFTKLVKELELKPSYANFNMVMGVFTCASQEYYRTVVVPYEEIKIRENGPVF